jgi:hypothetical protein
MLGKKFGLACVLFITTAAASAAAQPVEGAPRDPGVTEPEGSGSDFHPLSIEANPAALAIGRYSLQAEWAVAPHHVLLINPQYTNLTAEVSVSSGGSSATYDEEFTGFGGELGYRFYTGDRGMNGLFVGISALGGAYHAKNPFAEKSFTSFGGAVDVGWQAIVGPGILLGVGGGLQYAKASEEFLDLPLSASVIAGSGLRPRLLFSIGYAFEASGEPAHVATAF